MHDTINVNFMLAVALVFCFSFVASRLAAETIAIDAGYNYNYWNPNNIDRVDYKTTGLNGAFVEIDLPFYHLIANRPLLRYEWTPGDKRQQDQIQRKLADASSLEKIYEQILVCIPYKQILFTFEREAFIADLRLHDDRTYFTFNNRAQQFRAGETISELVVFQEMSCQWVQAFFGTGYIGISYGGYQKPFTPESGHYIYDAKFKYFSLDIGSASPKPANPGFALVYDVCISAGSGDIELSRGHSMNEMLSEQDMSLNSYAIRGMIGIRYDNDRIAAGVCLKGRGRIYNLHQEIPSADYNGTTKQRIGSVNKDSIFKAEASIAIKF